MRQIRPYICSIALLIFGMAGAQSVKIEKNFDETYLAVAGGRLDIANKYGEVIIRTWDKDSVRVRVEMKAEGKTTEMLRKSMDKVDIVYHHVGNNISVTTRVIQPTGPGVLKDLLNEVDDYSKTLFASTKLTVNYEVWLPANFNLSIDNKFGDVYTSSLTGSVYISLAHGDIKANRLDGQLDLKHSYGKSSFDFVKKGSIVLRGAEIKIEQAERLNVESGSSELTLGKLEYLQLNSRNDKVSITEVNELLAEGSFTDLNVDLVLVSAHLDFTYGDIFITRIQRDFKSIDIIARSADINLILDQASYIQTKLEAPEDRMIVPNSMLTLSRDMLSDTGQVRLSGFVGNTQTKASMLNVVSDGGELIIAIKELPQFSSKD